MNFVFFKFRASFFMPSHSNMLWSSLFIVSDISYILCRWRKRSCSTNIKDLYFHRLHIIWLKLALSSLISLMQMTNGGWPKIDPCGPRHTDYDFSSSCETIAVEWLENHNDLISSTEWDDQGYQRLLTCLKLLRLAVCQKLTAVWLFQRVLWNLIV